MRPRPSCAPLPESEVCGPGVCAQTLGGTTHDNGDRLSGPALEDIRARLLRHRTDAHGEDDVAIERHAEVRGQREEMRDDPRKRS